jgi:GNAT superfamily N-acetyltransferase
MIRQFRNEDARACSNIVRACMAMDPQISLEACGQISPWASPTALAEFSKLCYVAVYELGDQIVGICGLEMNEIRLLYVSPRHHGRGIGSILLEHLESMVPAAFFSDIFVYSARSAQGFYQAHGFGNRGEFNFQLSGIAVPTIFMVKPIGAINR